MIHTDIQQMVADRLRGIGELSAASVVILEQNSEDLAFTLAKAEGELAAPVIVVGIDDITPEHTSPMQWTVRFSLAATEIVTLNRDNAGYLTALDAVMIAATAIDGICGNLERVTHRTPGGGILEATAVFSGKFSTTTNNNTQEE